MESIKRITDEVILTWMETGHLYLRGLEVYKYHSRKQIYILKTPNQHPVSGRWRYKLQVGHTQRTIFRNRLVWLWEKRELIPEGMDVDHINGDSQDDRIDNLRLRDPAENRRDNTDKDFEICCMYFEAIAFLGHEPAWSLKDETKDT